VSCVQHVQTLFSVSQPGLLSRKNNWLNTKHVQPTLGFCMFGQISEDCAGSKRCCSNVEASFGVGVPPKLWVGKGNMNVPSTTWIISYGIVEKQQSSAVLIGKSSTELAQSHPFFKGIFNHQRVFVSTPILPGDVLHHKMHKNRGCPNWRRRIKISAIQSYLAKENHRQWSHCSRFV